MFSFEGFFDIILKEWIDNMEFLKKLNINIKNKKLFEQALTHSSYSNEHRGNENYERLEFLGDAVLELISSEYFYLHSNDPEGVMTKNRARYVCEEALATYAKKLEIDKYIRLGQGQMQNLNDTIIADVFEAVIGALYLDQGYDVASCFVLDVMVPFIENQTTFNYDYKSLLQEYVQLGKKTLEYEVVKEYGEAHAKTFEVIAKIDNIVYGRGTGHSKKEAEQKAAFDAYQKSAK